MAKPPRARTIRRARTRSLRNLGDKLDRLIAAQPGGAPGLAMAVPSSPAAQARVGATPCPRCGARQKPQDQTAEMHAGRPVLVLTSRCDGCAAVRRTYFVVAPAAN